MSYRLAVASLLLGLARGQQVGTLTAEVHPALTWQTCTAPGSCTTINGKVVMDSNWRWLHSTSGSTNCYTGNTWDATLCPDDVTCAANCALDGADYSGTYGVTTTGNALRLNFVTTGANKNVGSRLYLLADDNNYEMFNLNGKEFTFDVDVSHLPCGLNGALYMVPMSQDGGKSEFSTNKAGAAYGVGYCDSQCPRDLKFINGAANSAGWVASSNSANSGTGTYGSCCSEMDIWEANSMSTALTPHSANPITLTKCDGDACGGASSTSRYSGVTDPDGCDFNPYRQGNTSFYGPGKIVNTNSVFTVVTQFIGTSTTITEIKRFYVQGGFIIPNSQSTIPGVTGNSITTAYCTAQKAAFGDNTDFFTHGGLQSMATSFTAGMVLVLSVWDDYAVNMLWLDSTYPTDGTTAGDFRGSCATTSGSPPTLESQSPNSYVIYSNIRIGPINSTFTGTLLGGGNPGTSSTTAGSSSTTKPASSTTSVRGQPTTTSVRGQPTTTSARMSTTTSRTTTTTPNSNGGGGTAAHWGQCAGIGYTGPTVCASPWTCQFGNPYYSQCL